jgi:vacuolar-type H+-ATPase subunit D/Vma8
MAPRTSDTAPDPEVMTPRTALAREIRAYLERRRERLSDEIRHYPTPIARCDVQLGALLEARAEVVALLERGDGEALVERFAAASGGWGDVDAERLRAAAAGASLSSFRS